MLNDIHCHFFSRNFFRTLGRDLGIEQKAPSELCGRLGWDPPKDDEVLADRWVSALDANGVSRAMLIASVPGDEDSVAVAVKRHPTRLVGAFMLNTNVGDTASRIERAFGELGMSTVCLFPAMHHVPLNDSRSEAILAAASRHKRAVFVHCGVLSVGVRRKLGLPSRFDLRLGDPLAVAAIAVRHPDVPVIIPHFGAGFFRETLMAADEAANILIDTSSSNGWMKFTPGMTLKEAFSRALDVVGPSRLVFGTDSSFFPRGWQKPIYETQRATLTELGVSEGDQELIFGGNFERVFATKDGDVPGPLS